VTIHTKFILGVNSQLGGQFEEAIVIEISIVKLWTVAGQLTSTFQSLLSGIQLDFAFILLRAFWHSFVRT